MEILKPGIFIALVILIALNIVIWILLIRVTKIIRRKNRDLDNEGKKEAANDKCPTLTSHDQPE